MLQPCCRLTPAGSSAPLSCLLSPLHWDGEDNWKVESTKLMACCKCSLTGKAKATRSSKANQGINSLLPKDKQVFSHLQESRAPSSIMVTWEDKHHPSKLPICCPSFPQLLVLSMTPFGMDYQSGSVVQPGYPPSFLCTPSLLTGRAVRESLGTV